MFIRASDKFALSLKSRSEAGNDPTPPSCNCVGDAGKQLSLESRSEAGNRIRAPAPARN
jgi:hypothetical protein